MHVVWHELRRQNLAVVRLFPAPEGLYQPVTANIDRAAALDQFTLHRAPMFVELAAFDANDDPLLFIDQRVCVYGAFNLPLDVLFAAVILNVFIDRTTAIRLIQANIDD